MTKKYIIKTTIIIATLTMLLVMSNLKCNDDFDDMCLKYTVQENLHSRDARIDNECNAFPEDIRECIWAFFKITLTEELGGKEIELTDIINEEFLNDNKKRYYSICKSKDGTDNVPKIVYLFITNINTWYSVNDRGIALFRETSALEEVEVICSHCPQEESFDLSYLFLDCKWLTKVDLKNLDLNNSKNSANLFSGCDLLRKISFPISVRKPQQNEDFVIPFFGCYNNKYIAIECTGEFLCYLLNVSDSSEGIKNLKHDEYVSFMYDKNKKRVFLYDIIFDKLVSSKEYNTFYINVKDLKGQGYDDNLMI